MPENRPASVALFQLHRLPKERKVLDFALQKLGEGVSPERYEFIESLLNLYRTSAGFDPETLAKVRFKRMKAAEFRQTLLEIDHEIEGLLQSVAYKELITEHSDYAELFKAYQELSEAIQIHPPLSLTDELASFEALCETHFAEELILNFYRQHSAFLEAVFHKEGPDYFLKKYDEILKRENQLQRQFRIGFELIQLEQAVAQGFHAEEKLNTLLQELGKLLTLEKQTNRKHDILLKIIRAALLTFTPARHLSPYLDYMEESMYPLFQNYPESKRKVLAALAHYKINAGREKRLHWIKEAETDARLNELHDERPGLRFVRCIIEADNGDYEAALRCLHEAEHLIYKASSRSLPARNNWIRLSELKTLLLALKAMQGEEVPAEQFSLLQALAEDMGRHRNEIAIITQEWKGLQHFINHSIEDAFSAFEKAKAYRKNQSDHPWQILTAFFCALLSKSKKKNETASFALLMEALKEPFYAEVCGKIMKLASSSIKQKAVV